MQYKHNDITNYIIDYLNSNAQLSQPIEDAQVNFINNALLDSFGVLTMIMDIENQFSISFEPIELTSEEAKTIQGLAEIVMRKIELTG